MGRSEELFVAMSWKINPRICVPDRGWWGENKKEMIPFDREVSGINGGYVMGNDSEALDPGLGVKNKKR